MSSIRQCEVPVNSLLCCYKDGAGYVDCYVAEVPGVVTQKAFIGAFCTSPLFKVEAARVKGCTPMRKLLISSMLLACLPCVACAAGVSASSPESLYVLSAHNHPAEDGSLLSMTIRETDRTPEFSMVSVEYVSGAGASSLFLVRGLCGLMLARAQKLAVAEQISEHPVQFRMTFPTSAKLGETRGFPRMVLTDLECARITERHQ